MLCEEVKVNVDSRYKLLIKYSPNGIILVDLDGYIVEINSKALDILGSPGEEYTKQINMLTFPPLQEAGVSTLIRSSLSGEKVISGLMPYTSTWGKSVKFKFTVVPVLDDKDEVCFALLVIEDYTDFEKAKDDLCKLNKLLVAVINGIPDLVWLKDLQGVYLNVNKSFEEFNQFFPGGVVGKTDHEIWPKDVADRVTNDDLIAQELDISLEVEEKIDHPLLGIRYYHTTKTAVRDKEGVVFGTVGISRDITPEVNRKFILEDALKSLTNSLESNVYIK